jgi:hypothetical protein
MFQLRPRFGRDEGNRDSPLRFRGRSHEPVFLESKSTYRDVAADSPQRPECVGGNAAPNGRAGRFKVIFCSRTRAKLADDPTVDRRL